MNSKTNSLSNNTQTNRIQSDSNYVLKNDSDMNIVQDGSSKFQVKPTNKTSKQACITSFVKLHLTKNKQVKFIFENKYPPISLDDNATSESTSNQSTTNNNEIDEDQLISVLHLCLPIILMIL